MRPFIISCSGHEEPPGPGIDADVQGLRSDVSNSAYRRYHGEERTTKKRSDFFRPAIKRILRIRFFSLSVRRVEPELQPSRKDG